MGELYMADSAGWSCRLVGLWKLKPINLVVQNTCQAPETSFEVVQFGLTDHENQGGTLFLAIIVLIYHFYTCAYEPVSVAAR